MMHVVRSIRRRQASERAITVMTRLVKANFRTHVAGTMLMVAAIATGFVTKCTFATPRSVPDQNAHVEPPFVRELQPARHVEIRLKDGVRLTGTLTSWDDDGIDGSFGRRAWTELRTEDAWNLAIALMDRQRALDWVNLGRVMLVMPEGTERAESALRKAIALDPASSDAVAAARAWAQVELDRLEEARAQAEAAQLRTASPEAGPWAVEAWPALSAEERIAATQQIKLQSEDMLTRAGLSLTPVESDWFVLYSDAPRAEAAMWVIRLERAYRRLARLFEMHTSQNVFHGKAAIFVFKDHDRFRLVEAESFKQLVPHSAVGLAHYDGPTVFMCFHRHEDDDILLWNMIIELSHAFMHRFISPIRLPAWANEGVGEFVAAEELRETLLAGDRRELALSFIRSGGSVAELLDRTYEQFDWTDRWARMRQVSGLLVELMIKDRPAAFVQWVLAVKRGKPWRDALLENFGVEPMKLIETSTQHYMVND